MLKISKMLNMLIMAVLLVAFTSCGDLFMKGGDKEETYSQFATCEFDTEAISRIMTKNIRGELLCLEHNLNLFIEVVKTDRPGYLSQKELKKFIQQNMKNVSQTTLQALGGVFDLNSLLFGDDVNYIKKPNVKKLVKLLIEFNTTVVKNNIYEYFTTDEVVTYAEHNKRKAIIYNALSDLGKVFLSTISDNKRLIKIDTFLNKFEDDENAEILSDVRKLLFVKKAILGGDEFYLTAAELKRFTSILGDLSKVAYDLVNLPDTKTEAYEDEKVLKILKEDVKTVQRNFYYKTANSEPIFTYTQLVEVMDKFFPDYAKYVKYKSGFLTIKEILLESNDEVFTASEFNLILSELLYKNLSKGVFFYRSYRMNSSFLDSVKEIVYDFINLPIFNFDERPYKNEFNRIVQNYRFFKGSEFAPNFTTGFSRNARGVFEVATFEYIVQKFFQHFGEEDSTAEGDYILTQTQLEEVFTAFAEILEGEDLILPGRAKNTAETVTLMTSLFHIQSNGDARIEIPEFVEFITTMLTSLELAEKTNDYLMSVCPLDDKDRYQPSCYRKEFSNILSLEHEGKRIDEYLPKLADYVYSLEESQLTEYLSQTATFSRTCHTFTDGSEVPMDKSDAIVSWAGLLVIEQSILRFDKDNSNILEPKEVDQAFKIYKGAVEGLIPIEFIKRYSKSVFLYLVKYKKVPETEGSWFSTRRIGSNLHFAWFLARSYNFKKANADRMTFAAVLKIIAEKSPARMANPFPCDTLR